VTVQVATFDQLGTATLYALLRLRVDVFVVEQECPYPELDGRDTEPGTRHLWLAEGARPVAYLRMLAEPDGTARIGRVCVAPAARGRGLAGRLMATALDLIGPGPCVLDAQAHLTGFYAALGFTPTGPEYLDDGIPHVPMKRQGSALTSSATDRRRPV
jgi:ElaA protein